MFFLFFFFFFFFNETATTEIYTLSLHDALPISSKRGSPTGTTHPGKVGSSTTRSEEHTSELQSHVNLVCRLLLEKKKKQKHHPPSKKKNKNQQHKKKHKKKK